jgi:hypothetical protein
MREDTWGKQTTAVVDANGGDAYACHTATVLALNTAMRKDEIRLLRWGQVDSIPVIADPFMHGSCTLCTNSGAFGPRRFF